MFAVSDHQAMLKAAKRGMRLSVRRRGGADCVVGERSRCWSINEVTFGLEKMAGQPCGSCSKPSKLMFSASLRMRASMWLVWR